MRIKQAAIRKGNGKVVTLAAPNRHKDVAAADKRGGGTGKGERGFVLSNGKFVGRQEAKQIALDNGQIKRDPGRRGLHSEDLW